MLELTVIADLKDWILVDEDDGEVGRYPSRAHALTAASEYAHWVGCEPPHVLIQTDDGDWEEALVQAPAFN